MTNPNFYLYEQLPESRFHEGDIVYLRNPDGTLVPRKMIVINVVRHNILVQNEDDNVQTIYSDDVLTHNSPHINIDD